MNYVIERGLKPEPLEMMVADMEPGTFFLGSVTNALYVTTGEEKALRLEVERLGQPHVVNFHGCKAIPVDVTIQVHDRGQS